MDNTNTVFTITPPDLRLSNTGPSILLLGMELLEIKPYIKIIDSLFPMVEISYYAANCHITNDNVAWHRAVAGVASSIFINIDSATTEEVVIALEHETSATSVYWIGNKDSVLKQLLNSYQYQIFPDTEKLSSHLTAEFK